MFAQPRADNQDDSDTFASSVVIPTWPIHYYFWTSNVSDYVGSDYNRFWRDPEAGLPYEGGPGVKTRRKLSFWPDKFSAELPPLKVALAPSHVFKTFRRPWRQQPQWKAGRWKAKT